MLFPSFLSLPAGDEQMDLSLPFSLLFDPFSCGFPSSFSLLEENHSSEVNYWEAVLTVSRASQNEIFAEGATDFVAGCLTD